MNYYELVQWQKFDPDNGLVMPWFTHPFLEELKTWELEEKVVLEYGGGRSTAWWRRCCDLVVTVEANVEYAWNIREECVKRMVPNGVLLLREVNEGDREKEHEYVLASRQQVLNVGAVEYDIVVVDGIFRYECMREGIKLLCKRGGRLIVDNWDQDGFLCPACVQLMEPYKGFIYPQPDHTDHHGNCWKTAYFIIPPTL
jgi:hypothetical protein